MGRGGNATVENSSHSSLNYTTVLAPFYTSKNYVCKGYINTAAPQGEKDFVGKSVSTLFPGDNAGTMSQDTALLGRC